MQEISKIFLNKIKKILPLFFLFFFVLITFFRIIFLNQTFFGGDNTLQVFPIRMYVAEMLKQKIFPLWTPDIFCGYPLFAGGEVGVLSPFNLLFSLFPSVFTYNLFLIILPYFLSCIFTYYLCRMLLLDRFSSCVASLSYFFSGFLFFFLCNPVAFITFSLLPLKLVFLEIAVRKNKISYLIFIVFILAVQFLSSNPQAVLISFSGVAFYSFFIIVLQNRNFLRWVFILFFLGIASILLASIQIFPTFELYKFARGDIAPSFHFMTELSASFKLLLAYFFHFGYPEEYGQTIQELGYADVLPFVLVLFGLFLRKDKLTKFLFISLAIFVALSLGKYNPLYKLFFHIPLINQMRYPILFLFLGFFFISILTGLSLNYILNLEVKLRKRQLLKLSLKIITGVYISLVLFSIFSYRQESYYFDFSDFLVYFFKNAKFFIILSSIIFGILILYFSGKISVSWFKKGIIFFIFFTLFLTPPYLLPYLSDANYVELLRSKDIDDNMCIVSSAIYPKNPKYVEFFKKEKEPYRIYNDYKTTPLQRSLGLLYNIPSVLGYLPLGYARFSRYLSLFYDDIYVSALDLMNVKYILDGKMEGIPVGVENEIEKLVYNNEIGIIENKKYLPRVFMVHEYLVIKDEGGILERLGSKNFNPLEYVILEEEPEDKPITNNQESIATKVNILKYTSSEVIIHTCLKRDGFLFLSDTYYPGWKVYVNGKEDKIYRANYLFRAVYLEKGAHKVRFVYESKSFKIGFLISISTLFILIAILVYAKTKGI